MVTISVIVTVYNSEDSIQQVIKSIKDQTGVGSEFNLEVIVVDDCSTDSSYEIASSICQENENFKVFNYFIFFI